MQNNAARFVRLSFACLVLFVSAHAQTPLTTVSGTIYNVSGQPAAGTAITVERVVKAGVLVSTRQVVVRADASGVVSFTVPRASVAYLSGYVMGLGAPGAGRAFTIPDTSTVALESLVSVALVPTAGLTVQLAGAGLTHRIGTINFISGATVTESAPGIAAVTISGGGGSAPAGSNGVLQKNTAGALAASLVTDDGTTLAYSGTGGFALAASGGVAGGIDATEGTAPTGATGVDKFFADAGAHRWKMSNNNGAAVSVAGTTGATTTNNCAKFDANGNVVDAGAACSSGSGTTINATDNVVPYRSNSTTFADSFLTQSVNGLKFNASPTASTTKAFFNLDSPDLAGGAAAGTYLGANPAAAGADFFNFQVNGVSRAQLTAAGTLTTYGNIQGGGRIYWETNLVGNSDSSHIWQNGASKDIAGTITLTAATTGAHTFASAYNAAPACSMAPQFDVGSGVRFWVTTATGSVTVTTSASVTGSFTYMCVGNAN